ncbi:MAG TPA: hypothetical protein VNT75_11160 [Symbiobacteriaceae bacterium]|nr:hypothetical protein [Symbiobacteriaceae bacterium]
MLPFLLLLTGGAVSMYCLWQFRRWLGEAPEKESASAQRLEVLVDELVATAEATSAVVEEKAEALTELIAQADRRLGALAAASQAVPVAAAPVPAPVEAAAPVPVAAPEAVPAAGSGQSETHRKVYALADGGHDVTAIARRLGLSKGEVLLILGLRK